MSRVAPSRAANAAVDIQQDDSSESGLQEVTDPLDLKENDAPELLSDKKTDEVIDPQKQPGFVWRMGSGMFSATTGAVGLGYGGIKWVAGKGYTATTAVGGAVVGTTKAVASKVPIPSIAMKRKDKKE